MGTLQRDFSYNPHQEEASRAGTEAARSTRTKLLLFFRTLFPNLHNGEIRLGGWRRRFDAAVGGQLIMLRTITSAIQQGMLRQA